MDALLDYARARAGLPDEAAVTEFTPPRTRGSLRYALGFLTRVETQRDPGWVTRPVRLRGHARVLAGVDEPAGQLPQPPVDDEPVPPDQQHPLLCLVQYHRHRAPREPHHVLLEQRPVG